MGTPRMVPVYTDQELEQKLNAAARAGDADLFDALRAVQVYRVRARRRYARIGDDFPDDTA